MGRPHPGPSLSSDPYPVVATPSVLIDHLGTLAALAQTAGLIRDVPAGDVVTAVCGIGGMPPGADDGPERWQRQCHSQ